MKPADQVIPMQRNQSLALFTGRIRADKYNLLISTAPQGTAKERSQDVLSAWKGNRVTTFRRLNVAPGSYMPGET